MQTSRKIGAKKEKGKRIKRVEQKEIRICGQVGSNRIESKRIQDTCRMLARYYQMFTITDGQIIGTRGPTYCS